MSRRWSFRCGRRRALWLIGVAGMAAMVVGAGAAKPKEWKVPARYEQMSNPVPADEKSLAAGKRLYVQECLDCHGRTGKGDGPSARDLPALPPDLSDAAMWRQSDGALFYKITVGREPMPASEELAEEQRWHLVNYTRSLAPRPKDVAAKGGS